MRTDAGVRALFDEKVSFPELEKLQIFHMHRLGMIWKNKFLAAGSFEKLKVLKVEHANELSQLFPSNMLFGALRNLETLVVKHCDSMEQVFDMEGLMQVKEKHVLALKTLEMEKMLYLKRVWNGSDEMEKYVSWNNLRLVTAENCPSLKSLFPASIATDLPQLVALSLGHCMKLEEVVAAGLETSPTFFFPKLNFIQLCKLNELRNFYPGVHTLQCPALEISVVFVCPKLELFALDDTHVHSKTLWVQPLLSIQVVANLKKMSLSYKDAMMITQSPLTTHLLHKLEELQLEGFQDRSPCLEFDLLRRFQNLQKLEVCNSHFEELFPRGLAGDDQNVGILAQIRFLKLNYLPNLRRIWNEGSQHKQVLQNLDFLHVHGCHGLTNLAPSFAFFQNLQTLYVIKCDGLMNLFESMAAKSLVHLRTLRVTHNVMVREIVATEADEIQTEITLSKLESLQLHRLESLMCFTLADCAIKFPSLTELIITQCPKMEFFSRGNLYAPKLKKVYVTEESDKWRWVGDLNSTIKQLYVEMAGFNGIQQLELSEFPELKKIWHAPQLPVNFFYNLTSLVIDDCAFQSVAIPSNILPVLIALEKLEIRNCDSLEELYDLERPNVDRNFGYLPNLKVFQLIDLPQLRHVWDGIPKDMLDVKNLTLLKFHNCSRLRNILSPTMCLGLVQLKSLQVTSCQMVEEIIIPPASKDRAIAHTIVFPLLECIVFNDLPNLTVFYSETGFVECPCLEEITIIGCPQLNITNPIVESKFVSFPHLKELKVSSIDIQKTWNCQSLTSLTMGGFSDMKFMFSSSVAKSLVHLKKVEISDCGMLEQVIAIEAHEQKMMRLLKLDFLKLEDLPKLAQFCTCDMLECPSLKELEIENCPQLMAFVSDSTCSNIVPNGELQITTPTLFDEKVSFPNVVQIEVINMGNLRTIWSNNLHSDSFGKLEVLKVEYGEQLMDLFPHNVLERLQNLKEIVIKNCDSLEEVFDIHALKNAKEMERVTSQLKTLDIQNMLNLRCVWNDDPKGIVSFDEMSSIHVWECPNLKSLFPLSLAKSLQQLEHLELDNSGFEELVTKEKGVVEEAPEFVFPCLKYLSLWDLEKLECFFRGIHTFDCPVLEKLSVHQCEKLEVFSETTEDPPQRQIQKSLFSFSKIISNMERVSLTSKDAVMIKKCQYPPQLFHKLKGVELHSFNNELEACPSDLFKLFHNMERLTVSCSMLNQLFHHEGLDETLQTLIILKVSFCNNLINLAPFSVSFQNLSHLEVDNCNGLVSLMGLSTARSLAQLQQMIITNCDQVSQIVSNEGSDDESKIEVIFYKLETLELNSLPSLTCFCSAECSFKFPYLTELIASQCPNIKFFSKGDSTTPKLKRIQLSEEDKGHWNGNLNTTIEQLYVEMAGFDGMEHLKLSVFPQLQEKWLAQLQVNFFCNLTSLVVDDCAFQSVAIPSNRLPLLIALETLEIRNCDLLQELYDLEWPNDDRSFGYLSNLKEFQLIDLPLLRHVWDELPKDMLDVKNLTLLKFHNCGSLRSILTPTMCLGLVQLTSLEVTSCQMVEVIITPPSSKDGAIAHTIVFPLLAYIIIEDLSNLTDFYSGIGSLECPYLTEFTISGCPQLNITSTIPESTVVSYPHLKDLKPSSVRNIWTCQSLTSLIIDGLRNWKFLFSSSVVKSLVHLENLEISNCQMLEQVAAMEGQEEQMMRLQKLDFLKLEDLPKLAQFCTCDMLECPSLKELQIENCPQLMAFVSDSKGSNVVTPALFDEKVAFPNLEALQVIKMDNLISLAPLTASFQNLTNLEVDNCSGLVSLMGHSTAASLVQLQTMKITNCQKVSEIVSNDGSDYESKEEITFNGLQSLELNDLPSLVSFCSEECNFNFPSLTEIIISECPSMKFFSRGVSTTPEPKRVELSEEDEGCWYGDLNTTLQELFIG